MKIKLTRQEKAIVEIFGSDEKYQLYKCEEHGLQAKLKDTDNGLCSHCKKILTKKNLEDFK